MGGRLPRSLADGCPPPGHAARRPAYTRPGQRSSNSNGCGNRWKWPTLTHSVRPRRVRRVIGWWTCPNTASVGRCSSIASSSPGTVHLQPARHARRIAAGRAPAGRASTGCRPGPPTSTAAAKSSAERISGCQTPIRPAGTRRPGRDDPPATKPSRRPAISTDLARRGTGAGHRRPRSTPRRRRRCPGSAARPAPTARKHLPVAAPTPRRSGCRPGPAMPAHRPRLSSRSAGNRRPSGRDELAAPVRSPKTRPRMPGRRVVVVDVVEQVAEHHELFSVPGDVGETGDVAVDVGDERKPHGRR